MEGRSGLIMRVVGENLRARIALSGKGKGQTRPCRLVN